MTVVMFGLPIYLSYSTVRNGWTSKNASGAFGLIWAVLWAVVAVGGGWMFKAGQTSGSHWPIGWYAVAFIGLVAVFLAGAWAISSPEGRQQIRTGLWVFPALVLPTFTAYFGDEGHSRRYGTDVIIVLLNGVITYVWAVRTGYRTDELDQTVRQQIRMEEEEREADKVFA